MRAISSVCSPRCGGQGVPGVPEVVEVKARDANNRGGVTRLESRIDAIGVESP
jgi:hypothetical protein